jgi:hypothetical protein
MLMALRLAGVTPGTRAASPRVLYHLDLPLMPLDGTPPAHFYNF